MNIKIQVKKIGSKKAFLSEFALDIDENLLPITLEDFIKAVVNKQVERFNDKASGKNIIPYLTKKQIEEKAERGKGSNGSLFNDKKQDAKKACDSAVLAHQDGLYKVFADGNLIDDLKEKIHLKQGSEVSFVRLTFLTGGIFYG